MRRAMVEAAKRAYAKTGPCACDLNKLCDLCATNIARAVLKAALTGQPVGEWEVCDPASDGTVRVQYGGHMRERPRGFVSFIARDAVEARAVANALNLGRDFAAGGTDGE